MKVLRLRLKNLASFKKEIVIDFTSPPLEGNSIYAITGPTGAGKTTLLDGISLALFGKTPRLDGSSEKNSGHIIRQGEKEGFAELHFSAKGGEYIARWHGKLRKNGTYERKAELYAAGTMDVISRENTRTEQLVEEVLGLDYKAFKLSVMLAQGEFAKFLKSKSEDKRDILEKITGLDIYERLKKALKERKNSEEKNFELKQSVLTSMPDISAGDIEIIEKEEEKLTKELDKSKKDKTKLDLEKSRAIRSKDIFENLTKAKKKKEKQEKNREAIKKLKSELALAKAAKELEGLYKEKQEKKTRLSELKRDLKNVENSVRDMSVSLGELGRKLKSSQSELDNAEKNSGQKLGLFMEARQDEARGKERLEQANKQQETLKELESDAEKIEQKINKLAEEIKDTSRKIDTANSQIRDNNLSGSYEEEYSQATHLQGKLEQICLNLKREDADLEEKEKELTTLEADIGEVLKDKREKDSDLVKAKEQLRRLNSELEKASSGKDEENLKEEKQKASSLGEPALRYENLVTDQNRIENEITKAEKDKKDNIALLKALKRKLSAATEALNKAKEEERIATEQKEKSKYQDAISKMKKLLKKGEACPVCGSKEHEADGEDGNNENYDNKTAENTLKEASIKREKAFKEELRLENEISGLKKENNKLDGDITGRKKEISNIDREIKEVHTAWREVYPEEKVSYEFIKRKLNDIDMQIGSIRKIREDISDKKHELKAIEIEKSNLTDKEERAARDRNKLEESVISSRNIILKINKEKTELERKFYKNIPPDFAKESPKKAIESFKTRIHIAKQADKKLTEAKATLDSLDSQKQILDADLKRYKRDIADKRCEIVDNLTEGKKLIESALKKTGGDSPNVAEEKLKNYIKKIKEDLEAAKANEKAKAMELARKESKEEDIRKNIKEIEKTLTVLDKKFHDELVQRNFATEEEFMASIEGACNIEQKENNIAEFETTERIIRQEIKKYTDYFRENEKFSDTALPEIEKKIDELEEKISEIHKALGECKVNIKDGNEKLKNLKKHKKELQSAKAEKERWEKLDSVIPRSSLRDFALESMFDILLEYTNKQLNIMTERYKLKKEKGLKITLIDIWNAGEMRPVETLSGGESFLTSLALALALSELSSGRAELDSLFLDEGFGTLDPETLETALCALEGLRISGRTIGLISHISELTQRIPSRIEVYKTGAGESDIRVIGACN